MGISFKLSKTGSRFVPKPSATSDDDEPPAPGESAPALAGSGSKRTVNFPEVTNIGNGVSNSLIPSAANLLPEQEVSFTLTLYQKGYCIGETTKIESVQPSIEDGKSLHPYDRASEALFTAIESGWLPGDILDDIPIKYYNGSIICEVHDYRKHGSEQGTAASAVNRAPIIHKVQLRMSLENIVKDMHLISNDSWTYSDLLEVESRIVKALQPSLHLDPTPRLDQLYKDPIPSKLNLGIGRKRTRLENPEVIVVSKNQGHGKKICIDKVADIASCKLGDPGSLLANAGIHQGRENVTMQHVSSGIPSFRPNNVGQDTSRSTLSLPSHAKLHPGINSLAVPNDRVVGAKANTTLSENLDGQVTPLLATKRSKQALGPNSIQSQQTGSQLIGVTGSDMQLKNQLLQQQRDINGMQCSSASTAQRYPMMNNMLNQEPGTSFYFTQQGLGYGAKEEQIDRQELEGCKSFLQAPSTENSSLVHQQSQPQSLLQHPLMRNHPQNSAQWQHVRSVSEKDMRKDDGPQRRKSVPSPHISTGPMVQSPVSSKSGEISSGSMGGQFTGLGTASAVGSQKDKLTATSNAAIGTPSVTSSPSDSMHRQHQVSLSGKRKTNPAPKTQSFSGVGSPASVTNMNTPLNANSPSIGTASVNEQEILERFAKLELINQRYQLNPKKKKVDDYPTRKPVAYRTHELAIHLSDSFSNENFRDVLMPISKSLIGGTINTLKSRTVKFIPEESLYRVSAKPQLLIMNESPFDGTVTMQYGDLDSPDTQDYHLTLPTTHYADLLAAQFCVLMEHDGYENKEDHIRPMQIRMVAPSNSLTLSGISGSAASEVKLEVASGQVPQLAATTACVNGIGSLNTSQNFSNNTGMLASVNNHQALTKSQGYLPGTSVPSRGQQADQSLLQQQLQQNAQSQLQHQQQLSLPHIQRSTSLLSGNPLSHMMGQASNLKMNANHMVDIKPTSLQLQMLQQAQQKQQSQPERKVMMEPNSSMNIGNIQNNMAGLGGLNNVIGLGGVRGISSSVGPIGLGNMTPNNLGAASNCGLRGPLAHIQNASLASKLRMAQPNRASAYGPRSGISAMPGSGNQMLPNSAGLSMLGHPLNRANISALHRNAMSTMGPPKITGTNFYLNPQQQFQLQQLQQQHLQQQQQQQLQQQISSPLQHTPVGSPAVAGSPSAMAMQQQISPQQIAQKTAMSPQQLSSGAMQQMNNGGNLGAGPASPQLSSQTHGSVGSVTGSPIEQLQGANKVGPSNNL